MTYRTQSAGTTGKLLRSRIVQVIIVLLIGFLAIQVYEQFRNTQQTADRRLQSEQEFYNQEEEYQQLAEQVAALRDSFNIEAEIRRHFDVAKEDEEVVIILEPPPEIESRESVIEPERNKKPWYHLW